MFHSNRSRLRGSVFAGLLALSTAGCSSLSEVVDFGNWDVNPEETAAAEAAGIAPIMRVAHGARAQGDLQTAAALYQRAHELAPEQVEPLVHLGQALSQSGAHEQAAEAFRRALVIDPNSAEALRGLGLAHLHGKQLDLAMARFYDALAIKEDVRLYNAIGVANDMKGDHLAAQTHYYLGLDVDPQNVSIRSNLGLSLALAGFFGDSVRVLDSVARDPRATPQHRQTIALAYGLAGDSDAAAAAVPGDLDEAAVARNLRYFEALRAKRRQGASGS